MTKVRDTAIAFGLIDSEGYATSINNEHGNFHYEGGTPEELESIVQYGKGGRMISVFTEFTDHRHQPLSNLKNYLEEL